jgi:hypothetical protein
LFDDVAAEQTRQMPLQRRHRPQQHPLLRHRVLRRRLPSFGPPKLKLCGAPKADAAPAAATQKESAPPFKAPPRTESKAPPAKAPPVIFTKTELKAEPKAEPKAKSEPQPV